MIRVVKIIDDWEAQLEMSSSQLPRDNQRCASYIDCPVVCGSQWDVVGHEVQSVEAHVLPHVHRRNDADLQFLDLLIYIKIFIFYICIRPCN